MFNQLVHGDSFHQSLLDCISSYLRNLFYHVDMRYHRSSRRLAFAATQPVLRHGNRFPLHFRR
ncbi:hypothetical protein BDQ17DRAFT_886328 [Cyathus striatus]|nr:hypothetical protein BDQ17DRAFT_886328 [Cyathus striatus]